MEPTNERLIAETIDAACAKVAALVPEALFVEVGRMWSKNGSQWAITVDVPRRDKRNRKIGPNAFTKVHGGGETLEDAILDAYKSAYFYEHGRFPITWKDYEFCPSCHSRNVRGETCPDCGNHLPPREGEPGFGRCA